VTDDEMDGYVALMGKIYEMDTKLGLYNLKGTEHSGDTLKYEDNIKMNGRKMETEGVNWLQLPRDKAYGWLLLTRHH
jgi:hypothetical protein